MASTPRAKGHFTRSSGVRDGRDIYYRRGLAMMAARIDTARGAMLGQPQQLFEGPFIGSGADPSFDVTADGHFIMVRGDDAALGRQVNVVTN